MKLTPINCLRLGWAIVPCGESKHPLIRWKRYQTELPTEEQVLEWMERLQPACWACITGELSNRVTLDFDGEKGERTRERMGLPAPHRRTPRGGHHVDAVWPGYKIKTLTCESDAALMKRCPGMDVKGDGGFAIVLGRSTAGEYEWLLDTTEPYVLSPDTWAVIQPPKPEKKVEVPKDGADKPNGSAGRVNAELLVRMALSNVAAGKGRNNSGAWLAAQLRDNNFSAKEALAVAFFDRCPPVDASGDENAYTTEEWSNTVESIYSEPARQPWSAPEETAPPLLLPPPTLLPPGTADEIPFPGPAQTAEPQPVPVPVDIADLLTKISVFTQRFVHMTGLQATVVALWVIHTHAIDAVDFTPYLNVYSAMLRSGKTRLLEILKLLVRNAWMTGRTTASALVRKIDRYKSTLLLDESDAAFEAKNDYTEALRGILNTGFERDGAYTMSVPVGNTWEPRDFSTFSAKAIAGIGNRLPDTVKDRAIPIALKRKLRSEGIERFQKRKVKPEGAALHKLADQWAQANITALSKAEPEIPEELDDRKWDVCEPLLAIADAAGGDWPELARKALVTVCGTGADTEDLSLRLLLDTRSVFKAERLRTETLLGSLMALSESPWRESHRNSPLTARQLADLLRPFEIRSRKIRLEKETFQGYLKVDFEDSWARYLGPEIDDSASVPAQPASDPEHPEQANVYAGPSDFPDPEHGPGVPDRKSEESPINTRVVPDVPDQTAVTRGEDDSADIEPWLTPEELEKYTASGVRQEARAPAQYQDWTPTDADSLDSQDEESD